MFTGKRKVVSTLRLLLEDWTNPLHLFCLFLCVLEVYDGLWHKTFRKTYPNFSWIVLLSVWTRFKNGNKASKKLLDHIYKGTKGE